jgi:hypothetical protein
MDSFTSSRDASSSDESQPFSLNQVDLASASYETLFRNAKSEAGCQDLQTFRSHEAYASLATQLAAFLSISARNRHPQLITSMSLLELKARMELLSHLRASGAPAPSTLRRLEAVNEYASILKEHFEAAWLEGTHFDEIEVYPNSDREDRGPQVCTLTNAATGGSLRARSR